MGGVKLVYKDVGGSHPFPHDQYFLMVRVRKRLFEMTNEDQKVTLQF